MQEQNGYGFEIVLRKCDSEERNIYYIHILLQLQFQTVDLVGM